ncbi:MAG: LysR family transcriptional regulator [Rhodobacteraceae bacterium]|nr:LysR family transcriptional regulator [Paracoccaceae bacterium]
MSDINDIDIRLIDATLLLVFLGVMRHRKATAVAAEMGLTQPAVSHALKRLRNIYNDPLFLRRPQGLEPTSLAFELEPRVRKILALISETMSGFEKFDPSTASTDLRIGAFDYELTDIIPKLVTELRQDSPDIGVHAFPIYNRTALDALAHGTIDLSVGYFDFPTKGDAPFVVHDLFAERYVLAGRQGHPIFAQALTLQTISAARHLLLSPTGLARNFVDHALHLQGYRRLIQTIVPSLFPALSIIENSDLVVTLPERVARGNAHRFNLSYASLPFEGGTFKLQAVWHIRDAKNPLHKWLLDKIRRLSGSGLAGQGARTDL